MLCAKDSAEPFSGTSPNALKGHCSHAVLLASTMSAMPGNHAAPPPTAGPLSARMRTLRWSIMERRSSVAGGHLLAFWVLLSILSVLKIVTNVCVCVSVRTIIKPPQERQLLPCDVVVFLILRLSVSRAATTPGYHYATVHSKGTSSVTSLLAMPFTSAPAEKKRPSPVRTVKIVSGCSLRTRRAAMVEGMREPPKELRALGRLNWKDCS